MMINITEAAEYFLENDCFLLLCHASPDGDTVGSASALARVLASMGKKVQIKCGDRFTKDFDILLKGIPEQDFEPEHIVAIDVADSKLLGTEFYALYGDKIELCIDHHASNTLYAENICLEPDSASAAEVVYLIIEEMKAEITPEVATCLFTGVSTDTGCFRFVNTTVRTFEIAAKLAEKGAETFKVVQIFFETKTKTYAALERLALNDMRFYFSDRCALICITRDMFEKTGSNETETTSLANLTRMVEGVLVGVLMKEQKDGSFKISVRTNGDVDASEICSRLGGGGHPGAAACTLSMPRQKAINCVLNEVEAELDSVRIDSAD
ncbi:MAG: bifunctional oligoribonuclease/PAP phosphatase NrnA [Clostridia bacterium]|nr:bifunctional oligoribonuclease/PAP phosphatase NrnA [Clostridia bacterium]